MGQQIEQQAFGRAERATFKEKLRQSQQAFARMLADGWFESGTGQVGVEMELNLVGPDMLPSMRSTEVLRAVDNHDFQTELGRYAVEINIPPYHPGERGLAALEEDIRRHLELGRNVSRDSDLTLTAIGILPTIGPEHVGIDVLSPSPRFHLLNDQVFQYRGEDIRFDIQGVERLVTTSDSVAPESACTATQVHLHLGPEQFPAYWNAAQALAGAQVAACANSPFFLGRELWRETRIPLFEQAIDNRAGEMAAQGVRPRVWFGDHWIGSAQELFDENLRYFVPLLPVVDEEEPLAVLESGTAPSLSEMRLHNGTIYRWNRPVYDVVAGRPHLRVENRVPPSGPTVVDTMANAAFFLGAVRWLAEQPRPIWSRLSYAAAIENFLAGARLGLDATLYWPDLGMISVRELLSRRLIPGAAEGLRDLGVASELIDRLLGIIQGRATTGTNGAAWQARFFHRWYESNGADRTEALRMMTREYLRRMDSDEPVHTWPLG